MDAETWTLSGLFLAPCEYTIPIFQRRYVWREKTQWAPLWDDVRRVAEAQAHVGANANVVHFLGAIILRQGAKLKGGRQAWHVIDGQQRLTTFQLMLDAAELALADLGTSVQTAASQIESLTKNQSFFQDPDDHTTWLKLRPGDIDLRPFLRAMSQPDPVVEAGEDDLLGQAHEFFYGKIRSWLTQDSSLIEARAEALSDTFLNRLKLVAITVDATDHPNMIFEALNARGTPLQAWDLIKNYLLFEEQSVGGSPDDLYTTQLQPLEHDGWWMSNAQKGTHDIDLFLYYWLIMRSQSKVLARDIYRDFRQYAAGKSPTSLAEDVRKSGETYRSIFTTGNDTATGEHLVRWRSLDIGVSTPVVLWLLARDIDAQALVRALQALESFFVRRMICGIGVAGLNSWFPRVIEHLAETAADVDQSLIGLLRKGETHTRRWPDNAEFEKALVSQPVYQTLSGPRLRTILLALEHELGAGYSAAVPKPDLTIEHIMPQHWEPHYPLSNVASTEDETPRQQRERLIHTFGNLTLSQAGLGAKMGDGPWAEKSQLLEQFGMLLLTKDALDHASDRWTDDDIQTRSKRLAEIAIKIWPPPDKI